MTTQFFDTKGNLTSYSFACGYVQEVSHNGNSLRLWQEHSVYHVRQHDHSNGNRVFWESFETLNAARKHFSKAKRQLLSA